MSSRVIYVLGNYVAISFFYRLYEVIRSSLGRDCHSQLEYKFPSQRRASSFEIATSEYLLAKTKHRLYNDEIFYLEK